MLQLLFVVVVIAVAEVAFVVIVVRGNNRDNGKNNNACNKETGVIQFKQTAPVVTGEVCYLLIETEFERN